MIRGSGAAWAVAAVVLGACGGSDPGGGGGSCTPSSAATMTLAPSGVAPKAVCVLPGGTVTFVNQDTRPHDIAGDGAACAALNLGVIAPQASRIAEFPNAVVCTFRDAATPADAAFQGTVAVSAAPTEGPGY